MSDKPMEVEEEEKEGYEEYELKEALDCLTRAEEIKADSKLMAALEPLMERKVKAITSLAGLRKLAKDKTTAEFKKKKG